MIALASDHGGYELKQKVIGYLEANGNTASGSGSVHVVLLVRAE